MYPRSKSCCAELVAFGRAGGAQAAADHGVERLAAARRGAVETADIGPVASLGEALGDLAQMPGLVQEAPAGDGLCRLTSVGKADDQRRAGPQYPGDLADHLAGASQILDCAADR